MLTPFLKKSSRNVLGGGRNGELSIWRHKGLRAPFPSGNTFFVCS